MSTDLPIPDAAVSALVQAFQDDYDELVTDQVQHEERVRAIAAPVVAAELRRQAEGYKASLRAVDAAPRDDWRAYVLNLVVEGLTARADELDPNA